MITVVVTFRVRLGVFRTMFGVPGALKVPPTLPGTSAMGSRFVFQFLSFFRGRKLVRCRRLHRRRLHSILFVPSDEPC